MTWRFKSRRLHDVAVAAMREECARQIEQAGSVKAAAINLGYKPESFYGTLKCLGLKLERRGKK